MIVYCEVINWTYGDHFYGFLSCGDKRVQLEGKVTPSEADRLNREDNLPITAMYEAWDMVGKFYSEERLKRAAVTQYKTLFPGATALIHGDPVDPDPQPIWDGPYQDVVKFLIKDSIDFYSDAEVMKDIRNNWEMLLKSLEG